MVVRTSTASESAQIGPSGPIRSCIGCRQRAAAAELLRVVAVEGTVVPDPRSRAAGRGAWVHPDPQCVGLAERRRAFGRALRVPGSVDPAPVREYVAGRSAPDQRNPAGDETAMGTR